MDSVSCQQQLDDLDAIVQRRGDQRGLAAAAGRIDVDTLLRQQTPRHRSVASLAGEQECLRLAIAADLGIATFIGRA